MTKTGELCFIDTVGMSGEWGGGGKIVEDNGQGPAAENRAIPGLLKSKVTAVSGHTQWETGEALC